MTASMSKTANTKTMPGGLTRGAFLRLCAAAGMSLLPTAALAGCAGGGGDAPSTGGNAQQARTSSAAGSAAGTAAGTGASSGAGVSADSASAASVPAASAPSVSASASADDPKVLVAYFSATGHTERVAQFVADELGADLFQIVPQQPYTSDELDYNDPSSRVCLEYGDEALRDVALVETAPEGFDRYETVLLGHPLWWQRASWVVDRFVTDNDFTGKRVVNFCTSMASGIGDSAEALAEMAGTGAWQAGMRFSSNASEGEVREWARSFAAEDE